MSKYYNPRLWTLQEKKLRKSKKESFESHFIVIMFT